MAPKLRTVLIILILFAFPAISWFYLDAGLKYRMDRVNELDHLGNLSELDVKNSQGKSFNLSHLRKSWTIAGISDLSDSENYQDIHSRLYDAFKDRKELAFITISNKNLDSTEFSKWRTEWNIESKYPHHFLNYNEEVIQEFERIIDESDIDKMRDFDYMFLIDTAYSVRNVYDLQDKRQVDRMVEHIVLKLPYKK